MHEHIKTIWVKELRSDKYIQGKNKLRTTTPTGVTKHCCLGILSELCDTILDFNKFNNELGNRSYLHEDVIKWAGMTTKKQLSLCGQNDIGISFAEIADYIEQTWKDL